MGTAEDSCAAAIRVAFFVDGGANPVAGLWLVAFLTRAPYAYLARPPNVVSLIVNISAAVRCLFRKLSVCQFIDQIRGDEQ